MQCDNKAPSSIKILWGLTASTSPGMGEDIYTEAETHFSVELQGQDVVLRNFSPDGTFVNGVKVEGTVTLRLGQVIQLNKSGQEFRMIACFPES